MHIQKVKYIFIVMLTLSCGLKKFFQNIKIIVFQYIFCFFCWPNFLYWFLSKRNLEMSYFPLRAHFSTGPFASPFVLFLPHSTRTVTEWRFFLFSEYLSVSSITLHFSKTTMLCSWVTAVLECGGERWFWTAAPPAVLEWGGEPWFDACSESPSKHWFVRRLFAFFYQSFSPHHWFGDRAVVHRLHWFSTRSSPDPGPNRWRTRRTTL